jgi:TonB family protein
MFKTLLASQPTFPVSNQSALLALLFHAFVLVIAARATAHPAVRMVRLARDTVMLELPNTPVDRRTAADRSVPLDLPAAPTSHALLELPLVPLSAVALPAVQTGKLDIRALTGPGPPTESGSSRNEPALSTLSGTVPDSLPVLEGSLEPRYPEQLARTGMSGLVDLEYEVDSSGGVNPSSIRAIRSTHPAFAISASEAIRHARFRPARRLGEPVSVIVRQRIRFQNR